MAERRQKEFSDTHSLKKPLPEAGVGKGLGAANRHCLSKAKAERTPGVTLSWPLLNTQLQRTGLGGIHVTETNNHQIKTRHRSCTKKLQEKGKWSRCLTMGIYLSPCSFLKLHQNDRKEDPKVVPKGDNCRRKMAT